MLIDFHTHTELCCHADGTMEEYVRAAIAKDIKIFGFSAHSPWMPQNGLKMALSYDEVPLYVSRVGVLKERFSNGKVPQIQIRLGMEMDFLPDKLDEARRFSREIDFDYIIGSVHHIGTWGFDQEMQIALYDTRSIREVYESYFNLVKQLARSGVFDIIGHIDLVKKFGFFPDAGWDDIQEDVAKTVGESNMVVELNTAGFDKPVKECYPGAAFLARLKKYGVPITLGSDAHNPDEVGRHFDRAIALLKDVGYKELTAFEKRKKIPVPID